MSGGDQAPLAYAGKVRILWRADTSLVGSVVPSLPVTAAAPTLPASPPTTARPAPSAFVAVASILVVTPRIDEGGSLDVMIVLLLRWLMLL